MTGFRETQQNLYLLKNKKKLPTITSTGKETQTNKQKSPQKAQAKQKPNISFTDTHS